MKRKIGELILIIFFYLLQVTLGRVIAIGGIKPNLMIILPVLFVYIGYCSGIFYQKYEETEMLIPLGLLLAGDFCFGFLSYVGNFLLHNRLNAMYYISRFILPEVVYTLLIAVILYKPVTFLNKHLNPTDKRRISKVD